MQLSNRRHFMLASVATVASFAVPARAVTVVDALGTSLQIHKADRIVSIGSDVTETIFALGAGGRVVAVDTTSTYPPSVAALQNVGYMRALSAEGVLSLMPDVIIANQDAGPPDAISALRQSKAPVLTVSHDPDPAAIGQKIKLIGSAIGADANAERLAQVVGEQFVRLASAVTRIEQRPRVLFVLSMSGGRIIAAGTPSPAAAIIELAGAENALKGFQGFKPVNEEAILQSRPEAILVMKMPGSPPPDASLLAQPPFNATPAAKSNRLLPVDGSLLLSFGPRTPLAARDLAQSLHPGLDLPPLGG